MARLLNERAKISAFQAGDPGNQDMLFDSEIRIPAGAFIQLILLTSNNLFQLLNSLKHPNMS